jgi:putative transposase
MSETAMMPRNPGDQGPGARQVVDQELADQLLARAQTEGIELLGPDALLSQVTKAVLERALAEEMSEHLGYEKHDPAGRGSGNSRNGTTGKTLLTDLGGVELEVPRDRNGSFSPRIVRKGQTRLDGFNERIIALYARGLSTRDIRAHLREIYDVDVSADLISRVTDAMLEELQEWQARPLDRDQSGSSTSSAQASGRPSISNTCSIVPDLAQQPRGTPKLWTEPRPVLSWHARPLNQAVQRAFRAQAN